MSELISDDDQDSATDDFPPAAAVALAVCLTAVVMIVVVFVWRTRKSRRRPEARKLLYAPGPHKPRIWTCSERYFWFKLSYTFSPRGSRRWEEKGKVLNRAARASCAHSLLPLRVFSILLTHLQRPRKWELRQIIRLNCLGTYGV